VVETRLIGKVTVAEANRLAAREVMSRFAANPRWLIYLPATMAPPEASPLPGLVEHPAEAFAYYRNHHLSQVVCQEKHNGARAVVVVCRDEEAARAAFGVQGEGIGVVLTRTGRRFFDGGPLEQELLARLHAALGRASWWQRFRTSWVLLDAALISCSAGARELLEMFCAAADRPSGLPVVGVAELKLAPFHLLATEWGLHTDRPHTWHLTELAGLCLANPELLHATASLLVDPADEAGVAGAVQWWEGLTERGGEGMVVKPVDFIARGSRGLVQPAVKCRGPQRLRLLHGPEALAAAPLDGLWRQLLSARRGRALREFALGVEALERFVRREPLRRVHECCFSILALQSEAVDPRL
jgi:protein phosphatase